VCCAGTSSGLLLLVVSTWKLQGGVIQPDGDKFCRADGQTCVGLYLFSAYGQGAVCWTPLAALCSGVVFCSLCLLGCLLQATNNKTASSRLLVFISLSPARVLMAKNIPREDKRISLYLQNEPCSCSQV